MYEEENSPFEQRAKFKQQAKWRDDENRAVIDESYIEALEWGLPPTGGWGCGIDRLCMMFSGATRISDVLSFGSLRNVVGLETKVEAASDDGS
jgi:lysyl-tRNA synthetase class 2